MLIGCIRWARSFGGLAIALLVPAAAACSTGSGGSGGSGPSGGGACEVSGGIVRASCFEGWDDCGRNTSDKLHTGKSCAEIGYTRACCTDYGDATSEARYWRPPTAACDSTNVICGATSPTQDPCKRCLSACRGDPLCCTGSGCYCESECG